MICQHPRQVFILSRATIASDESGMTVSQGDKVIKLPAASFMGLQEWETYFQESNKLQKRQTSIAIETQLEANQLFPSTPQCENALKFSVNDLELLSLLGKASPMCKTLATRLKKTGESMALKVKKWEYLDHHPELRDALNYFMLPYLQYSNVPFAIRVFGCLEHNDSLYILMQLASGSIMYHLQFMTRFTMPTAQFYAAQLLLLIEQVHFFGFCGVNPSVFKLLLDKSGNLLVSSFNSVLKQGLSGQCSYFDKCYFAPEMVRSLESGDHVYQCAMDCWMLGNTIYELLVGMCPFYHENDAQMFHNILTENPKYPSYLRNESVKV